jgi:pimeloyl-ACP methyl ester carboxylesterase
MTTAAELMQRAEARAIKKSVTVAGVNCDYWFYPAQVDNPEQAPNVLLAHGYRGTHKGLESFAGGFEKFNVYAPDLPGFGSSEPLLVKHTLNNYVQWFQEFLSVVTVPDPILIGHSFGTLIVSATEAKFGLSKALVCINPVAGGVSKGLSGFLLQFVKGYYWVAHVIPKSMGLWMLKTRLLVDSMSSYTTKSQDKALRHWIKFQHRDHFNSFANSDVIWESYIASIKNTMQPYVDSIKKPILLVAAELDEITPISAVEQIAKRMPKSHVHEIRNCGHLVHYEAADETVLAISNFIQENR